MTTVLIFRIHQTHLTHVCLVVKDFFLYSPEYSGRMSAWVVFLPNVPPSKLCWRNIVKMFEAWMNSACQWMRWLFLSETHCIALSHQNVDKMRQNLLGSSFPTLKSSVLSDSFKNKMCSNYQKSNMPSPPHAHTHTQKWTRHPLLIDFFPSGDRFFWFFREVHLGEENGRGALPNPQQLPCIGDRWSAWGDFTNASIFGNTSCTDWLNQNSDLR